MLYMNTGNKRQSDIGNNPAPNMLINHIISPSNEGYIGINWTPVIIYVSPNILFM